METPSKPTHHKNKSPLASPRLNTGHLRSGHHHTPSPFQFGRTKNKLKRAQSSDSLTGPVISPVSVSQTPKANGDYFAPHARHHGHGHGHVLHRLQALFPTSHMPSPAARTTATPSTAPQIPELKLESDSLNPGPYPPLPKKKGDPSFLKVRIITWNHGYTLPKGDLSTLLGHVPPYKPPPDGHKDTLPKFNADSEHPYHIVVVAGQECPSQSNLPLGIGAGMKLDILERMERRRSKTESRTELGKTPEPNKDGSPDLSRLPPVTVRDYTHPLPSPQAHAAGSTSPARTTSPSPFQQVHGPSAHAMRSATSLVSGGLHHPVGWSMMLEDWFCNGAGSLPGAIPVIDCQDPITDDVDAHPENGHLTVPLEEGYMSARPPSPYQLHEGQESHVPWHTTQNGPAKNGVEPRHPHHGQGPYVLVVKERLMAIALYIFVHRDAQHLVTDYSKSTVKAGLIGGRVGNKGAIGVSMKVAGTSLLFVNAHLAAHEERAAERVANMVKIKAELELDNYLRHDDPRAMSEDITDRYDHTFVFGDLNFRINVTRLHAEWLISRKDYATALQFDQLKEVMQNDTVFDRFEEAPINFDPTFKYDVLQTLKKHRSVRKAIQDRAARHIRRTKRAAGLVEEAEEGEESDSSSSEEDLEGQDGKSVSSSVWTGVQSHHTGDGDGDGVQEVDLALLPAAENAKVNALSSSPFKSAQLLQHPAAHRAKEKLLGLLQRNSSSPAMARPGPSGESLAAPPALQRNHAPHHAAMPVVTGSAQTSIELPRGTNEPTKPPPLRRATSIKSGGLTLEDGDRVPMTDRGVYDSSSKQRVPSWLVVALISLRSCAHALLRCDRILFKSTIIPEDEEDEPEDEHEHPRFPVFRVSQLFASFMRHRKDSNLSIGSTAESSAAASIGSGSAMHNAMSPLSSLSPDEPSQASPADALSLDSPEQSPSHSRALKFSKSPSFRPSQKPPIISPRSATPEGMGVVRRRSFSASTTPVSPFVATPPPAVSIGLPLNQPPPAEHPRKLTHATTWTPPPNPRRWFPFSSTSRDATPTLPTVSLPQAEEVRHRRGDIVCLEYNTLDDRRMRQLEARSDHRPVFGDFAIYV
ncbi:hypothetical protein FRB94_006387 [Tulasnella sp. JGI-2019a]|nr:hypothetical protein FRB94_006387 [Tulasnella sp. JGI-2019a]KAG9005073.1 hypothetical protein FRB93_009942 [Tulasnella sp. JGI-2019a]KAG9037898.1 hypothetical protein FRB95_003738 [Tulasnella sp. JGI-2019a]